MQDNQITLNVDEANDGSTTANVDHVYQRFETLSSRSVFHNSTHQPDMRDILGFYRTPAKRSGNSRGKQRSSVKFTVDVLVPGVDGNDVVDTAYIEINSSLPLGVSNTFTKALRQRGVAILDRDDIMDHLNNHLGI